MKAAGAYTQTFIVPRSEVFCLEDEGNTSEIFVCMYQPTRRHIPEDCNIYILP
jgi:hypothetical protein